MIAAQISGNRLHLQHGPIDLIIGVEGEREAAFEVARERFSTVLEGLVLELPTLRRAMPVSPKGFIAHRMMRAASGYSEFVTPMAAVAGAVADEVLASMKTQIVSKAYVNNGGDIAIYLREGSYDVGVAGLDLSALGRVTVKANDGVGGIASSGRAGRSLSLGIADNVTVLARCAADADVAATLIANRVDLQTSKVTRERACNLDPDSDLGERLVVTGCDGLSLNQIESALEQGASFAHDLFLKGRIQAAFLVLQGQSRVVRMKELADA